MLLTAKTCSSFYWSYVGVLHCQSSHDVGCRLDTFIFWTNFWNQINPNPFNMVSSKSGLRSNCAEFKYNCRVQLRLSSFNHHLHLTIRIKHMYTNKSNNEVSISMLITNRNFIFLNIIYISKTSFLKSHLALPSLNWV